MEVPSRFVAGVDTVNKGGSKECIQQKTQLPECREGINGEKPESVGLIKNTRCREIYPTRKSSSQPSCLYILNTIYYIIFTKSALYFSISPCPLPLLLKNSRANILWIFSIIEYRYKIVEIHSILILSIVIFKL